LASSKASLWAATDELSRIEAVEEMFSVKLPDWLATTTVGMGLVMTSPFDKFYDSFGRL
jgi:hypothetical protein